MGMYINPVGISKEEWLHKNGIAISKEDAEITNGVYPVCLVDNGPFTAAAIAYNEEELYVFKNDTTGRRMRWYLVEAVLLKPFM